MHSLRAIVHAAAALTTLAFATPSRMTLSSRDTSAGLANDRWFNNYHIYAEHVTFLSNLTSKFSHNSMPVLGGTTYERRIITAINIFGSSGPGNKPAVIIHAGSDPSARITTMVAEQIAYRLLSEYTTSPTIKGYIDEYDIYIIPMVNPDGFVYTQTTDRNWSKNRQLAPPGSSCDGVYLNSNWNYRWGSGNPCSKIYGGQSPCDTPECQGLADFLNSRANSTAGTKLFLDFTGGPLTIRMPLGPDCPTKDAPQQTKMMEGFAAAFDASYNATPSLNTICGPLFGSGNSADYAYAVSNIKFSFGLNIPEVSDDLEIGRVGTAVYEGIKYLFANI